MAQKWKPSSSGVEVEDSLEAVYRLAYERGWTDGLPIIPPTEERVQAMLTAVNRDPGEVVAEVPPRLGEATIERIAINAVMAGCLPAYLPVVIAAVEAMTEPQFNLNGIQCTTNPATPLTIINGSIVKELDINFGCNCLGQGWRSNATIGRAIRLILLNIGGATPGVVDKATMGQPGKYCFCLAENEEANPWQPLHVERGFGRSVSTVTVVGATGTSNIIFGTGNRAPDALISIAHAMNAVGSNNFHLDGGGEVLVILAPTTAAVIAREGFSKDDVKRFLFENSKASLSAFSRPVVARMVKEGRAIDGMVALVPGPEAIMVIVAGGAEGGHCMFVPTFGDTRAVTKPISTWTQVRGG